MKLPKSFKLFASEYKVVIDNKEVNAADSLGLLSIDNKKLSLATKQDGEDLPYDTILDTFYHEIMHAMFFAINERDLAKNEKIVDILGKLLRQFLETVKFENYDSKYVTRKNTSKTSKGRKSK